MLYILIIISSSSNKYC